MTKKIPAKKTVVSKKTVKKPVKSVVSKTKTSAKAKVSVSKNSPKKTATKSKITIKTMDAQHAKSSQKPQQISNTD